LLIGFAGRTGYQAHRNAPDPVWAMLWFPKGVHEAAETAIIGTEK